jgi:hypothetical protein
MESKFENLLNRFESFVGSAENPNLQNENLDRFENLIERLEKIHYSSSS